MGKGALERPSRGSFILVGIVSAHLSLCIIHFINEERAFEILMRDFISFPQAFILNEEMLAGFFIIEQINFFVNDKIIISLKCRKRTEKNWDMQAFQPK